ncbi:MULTISPECIES: DUF4747 family protein [Acinetobacter]|uniref:DUF4747 domain-containing protein n=2 Tax=Acinetobacter calcoaceticus/baumannii complex TaxID=909768 RepID=A0AAV3IQW3_ACINO|nr:MULTISPECIES: DUF4747 family protein [Acinetobacter]EKU54271.1 hypothetical protein ACINWC487_3705 [Acinetobacter nosocomialis]ENV41894.1 hypothetical protein F958_01027 [Acinetobacter nosocomialis NIPH 386]EXI09929.1 hypothetical protein J604_3648 [Acinetobacter sp. 694762]KQD06876.1 hypothetical protein APD05_17020 [Acinetobacter nosocomialis]MBR7714221.1 DUF4747 family protein [Acinetobacter nosocomialis]
MSKQQTVTYTALDLKIFKENVTDETYVDLFKGLQTNHREIPLIRDNYLHIWNLKPINEDKPLNGFVGTIFKRNGLPGDWFNTEKETRNIKENVEEKYIPSNLKANVRFFRFVFYPLQKKIVCEIKNGNNKISESVIKAFFEKLLGTDRLKERFNRIDVSLVKDNFSAERIINTPQLTQLELIFLNYSETPKKQNSDLEKEIFGEMEESNIRTYSRMLTAEKTKFLELTPKNKDLIRLAVEHGYVNFKFKNFDNIVEKKSSNVSYPFLKRVTYDPKKIDLYALLLRETSIIAKDLANGSTK